jgi:outer membrane protein assembly factor BamE (lipoprotein component of BamABCDE complex)
MTVGNLEGCDCGKTVNYTARLPHLLGCSLIVLLLAGCQTTQEHAAQVDRAMGTDKKLTVGTVQRKIRTGMPSAEVIEALGSPNIVALDRKRREVWTYDRVATYHVYSNSSDGVNLLVLGGGPLGGGAAGGGVGGGYSQSSGASASTQKSLTIIIKFDKNGLVRDFAYRSSTF